MKEVSGRSMFHFGDMYDALAYDHVTGLLGYMAERLEGDIFGEFRTKSANISHLEKIPVNRNIVLGWSLAPEKAVGLYEHGTPGPVARLRAAGHAAELGWKVSLHLDPVIVGPEGTAGDYEGLINEMHDMIPDPFSVSVGTLRLNRNSYRHILRERDRAYILRGLVYDDGMFRYPKEVRERVNTYMTALLEKNFRGKSYVCMD